MLEEKIKWLIERCKASISISIQSHRDCYESISEHLEDQIKNGEINEDVLDEMIKRDIMVYVQAYPDTPVGFYSEYHYDLGVALDLVIECIKKQNEKC